jgi:hypothetical protein
MTVSEIQPSDEQDCQARTTSAGSIHPIHSPLCVTVGRRRAAKNRGQTLATGLSAMSVNPVSRARPRRAAGLSVGLPRPNDVPDTDRRRNQPEPLEAVRDSLLLGENVIIERPERKLRPVDGPLLRREVNAARLGENGRNLIAMFVCPFRGRRDGAIDRGDVRMLGGEVAIDQKE